MRSASLSPRRAFTLVELLVVIGIIALLIAILIPVINKARQAGNSAYCLSNLHQIGIAINMYTTTNKGILPFGWWGGDANGNGAADWTTLLSQVIVSRGGNTYTDYNSNNVASSRRIFTDKDTLDFPETPKDQWIHYGAHPRLMPALGGNGIDWAATASSSAAHVMLQPYKVSTIRRASEIALIMDATQVSNPYLSSDLEGRAAATTYQIDGHNIDGWPSGNPPSSGASFLYSGRPTACNGVGSQGATIIVPNGGSIAPGPNVDCSATQFSSNGTDGEIRWRHMGNRVANFLFVDGHCEGRQYRDSTHCGLLRKNVNADTTN